MLESLLGLSTLEKGLQHYLQKFKYSNAVTDDLWNSLSEEMGKQTQTVTASYINLPVLFSIFSLIV